MEFSVLLALLLIGACSGSQLETSLALCKAMLRKEKVFVSGDFNEIGGRVKFTIRVNMNVTHDLFSSIDLNELGPVAETEVHTWICVSFTQSVTYTLHIGATPEKLALAKLNYNPQLATGIVKVNTSCRQRTRRLIGCSPSFMAMDGILDFPAILYSPLEEKFWMNFQDSKFLYKDWIKIITVRSFTCTFPSPWMSFLRLSALEELDIAGNIWKQPERLSAWLPRLNFIRLNNNNIEELPADMFRYLPSLNNVLLGYNSLSHVPSCVRSVKKVQLDHQNTNLQFTLQASDFTTLQNLAELRFDQTHLESKFVGMLITLTNLKYLYLSSCQLEKIGEDSEIYPQNSKLLHLDLSYNNLTSLPINLFIELRNLQILNLKNNLLESCPRKAFKRMRKLKNLDLSSNRISELSRGCFQNLHALLQLDLSKNFLHILSDNTFTGLESLDHLDLSYNFIKQIPSTLLLKMEKLRTLSISHNLLLEEPLLGKVSMTYVDLSYNNLTRIVSLTMRSTGITFLNLSRNNISEFKADKISQLDLSYNALTYIPEVMWEHLEKLKLLDLGGISFNCCHDSARVLQKKVLSLRDILRNFNSRNPFTCSVNTKEVLVLDVSTYTHSQCSFAFKVKGAIILSYVCIVFTLILSTCYSYHQ